MILIAKVEFEKIILCLKKMQEIATHCNILMVLGYRSPMRPVPPEVFPDNNYNYMEGEGQNGNKSPLDMDSCQKDEWWREAMMVADKVENMPRVLHLAKEVCWCFYFTYKFLKN